MYSYYSNEMKLPSPLDPITTDWDRIGLRAIESFETMVLVSLDDSRSIYGMKLLEIKMDLSQCAYTGWQ